MTIFCIHPDQFFFEKKKSKSYFQKQEEQEEEEETAKIWGAQFQPSKFARHALATEQAHRRCSRASAACRGAAQGGSGWSRVGSVGQVMHLTISAPLEMS